ncbi:HAD hydrolase-like protein [Dyadobacter sp. CY345]|uniref:HAD hydrolase-like protein n=1 Tax=Dyadobacter sp. CY345 TaxID=2909335 RepID=UPI001F1B66E0|nr:HAD hydrolase-like protein [Dyadobacter sp. CY345]MCF2443692.1 HAD hydrolase-like protein [Dyadobacter sp. CY345]
MSIELVVFDMAGTTVKDKNAVGLAFQNAMNAYGYNIAIENINPIMGYEKPVAIRMMLDKHEADKSKITEQLIENIHAEFVTSMVHFYETSNEIVPLPNVEETFRVLREAGVKIALDTGFSKNIADVIIRRLGWADKIDLMVASDEVENGRPFPDMIEKIKAELDVVSSEVVAKVGDTEVDINEGINSGCKYVIGVTTGAFTREELMPYNPTHIIDDISEVIAIISEDVKILIEKES